MKPQIKSPINQKAKAQSADESTASWNYAEVWDKFPVPARPCPKELGIIKQFLTEQLKTKKQLNVLVLGSTIEYRSLLKSLGITPVIADFSRENFDSLTAYAQEKFEREEFVEIDWLHVNEKETFDVILGHRPINVIRPHEVKLLFSRMHQALKPGGVFFCRGNIRFPGDQDCLEACREKWVRKERPYPLFTYLEVALYFRCTRENGSINYPQAREIVNQWFREGKITPEDYDHIKILISMGDDAQFFTLQQEKVLKDLQEVPFQSVEWLFTGDEFTKNMPLIKLTKEIGSVESLEKCRASTALRTVGCSEATHK
ncbi:TPA: class I SAM-dependent methyltransferase [Candidatus Woesearchaeota archaeon]|nr:MAG: hypothetical protein QT07_C0002G0029 [archaeon GW2011_AR16]HIG96114.1 class I SAM-dependent methyltransferase [Candidatus Woesearchaeota archaeon]HII89249.1 class I SAM-dependent methyltransferase [Candidatus Woesearchaeota archaeon]